MAKHISKREAQLRAICDSLGNQYSALNIDCESCIFRDFGNGFNVEISLSAALNDTNPTAVYLWLGEEYMVKSVKLRSNSDIKDAVDELYKYSQELVCNGFTTRDKIYSMKYSTKEQEVT